MTVDRFDEATIKDVRKKVDPVSKARAKGLLTFYQGTTKRGIVRFKTTAQTTPRKKFWKQEIAVIDLPIWKAIPEETLTAREKVNMALSGNIRLSCDCPAFLYYGYRYILTRLSAVLPPTEGRRPKIRNPKLKGSVCKHLEAALRVLPFHMSDLVKAVK